MKQRYALFAVVFVLVLVLLFSRRGQAVLRDNGFTLEMPTIQPLAFNLNTFGIAPLVYNGGADYTHRDHVGYSGYYTARGSCKCQ